MPIACHPIIWEVEAGGSEFQENYQSHKEFEISLGYIGFCLKRQTNMLNE